MKSSILALSISLLSVSVVASNHPGGAGQQRNRHIRARGFGKPGQWFKRAPQGEAALLTVEAPVSLLAVDNTTSSATVLSVPPTTYTGTGLWFNVSTFEGTNACGTYDDPKAYIFGAPDTIWNITYTNWQPSAKWCNQSVVVTNTATNKTITATLLENSGNNYTTLSLSAYSALGGDLNDGEIAITYYFPNVTDAGKSSTSSSSSSSSSSLDSSSTSVASSALSSTTTSTTRKSVDVAPVTTTTTATVAPTTLAPTTTSTIDSASISSSKSAAKASSEAAAAVSDAAYSSRSSASAEKAWKSYSSSSVSAANAAWAYESSSSSAVAAAWASESSSSAAAAKASKAAADAAWSSSSSAAAAKASKSASSSSSTNVKADASNVQQTFTGGSATYYTQNGNQGACGDWETDSDYVAALFTSVYNNGSNCGKKVVITRVSTGKSVTVTALDECPTCSGPNYIDLSVAAFTSIATEDEGEVEVTYTIYD